MSLTAKITTVKIGSIEIEGLMFEDGRYGISILQSNELISFSTSNNTLSRDLKRLLGNGFNPSKVKVEGFKQLINALTLVDFENLLFELAIKGNIKAQEISRDLIGLSLSQLFADAFEVKFEKEERQAYLIARQQGKIDRLKLTDGIKKYMESNEISNGSKWFGGCSQNTYLALFGMTKSALLKNRGVEDKADLTPRDYMSADELKKLAEFENFAAILMVKENTEPFKAVQKAKEFYS